MSGLAGKVRRSLESDEFDLGGYDQAKCDEMVKAAFTEPMPCSGMVRLSFVVGGGKLVRQKYSDDLPKLFMGSLSAIGFKEDSTAAVEGNSAGKFKFQHDTGKNLKFVHVFPHVDGGAAGAEAAGDGEDDEEEEEKPMTPTERLFRCEKAELLRLIEVHLPTYAQKKRLLDAMKARIATLESIEGKMARLEQLTSEEQALFDDVGADELREKEKVLTAELKKMVDEGKLTNAEKDSFLEQLDGKLGALEAELEKAEAEGKAKKVQVLTQNREIMQATRTSVKAAAPAALPPLRHAQELGKLYRIRAEIERIKKGSKQYTMDELKKMGELPEVEEAIEELETSSRGWLEADEVFQQRTQAGVKKALTAAAASAKAKAGPASSSGGGSGFTSVRSGGGRPAKAKAKSTATRNAFGALG